MIPFFKKKEPPKEDILEQIEKETASLSIQPQPPKPSSIPLPSRPYPQKPFEEKPKALSDEDVAKLPLFMKISDYDKIVSELNVLIASIKQMEETLSKLTELEIEEREETKKWQSQLMTTKEQVRLLLSKMPETGKVKELLGEQKRQKKEKLMKDIEKLRKEVKPSAPSLSAPSFKPLQPKTPAELHENIRTLREEMDTLHKEFMKASGEEHGNLLSAEPLSIPKPGMPKISAERIPPPPKPLVKKKQLFGKS